MITYNLEYANDKELKYSYYPWENSQDTGYVIVSRQEKLLAFKLTKADETYPVYFEHMLCVACENAKSDTPEKHGGICWI